MQSSTFIRTTEGRATTQARTRLTTHTFASPVVRPLPRPTVSLLADTGLW
jgi:hypothetical protein